MILLEQPLVLMPAHRQRMKYKKYYRLPTMARYILLCYILFLSLFLKPTQAREADDRSRFLYADDPDAIVILEYQLHNAPSRDYTGDEQKKAAKEQEEKTRRRECRWSSRGVAQQTRNLEKNSQAHYPIAPRIAQT